MPQDLLNKLFRNNRRQISGFTLIELLVGTSVLAIVFVSLSTAYNLYVGHGLSNNRTIKAAYLLEEGVEAVKFWRDISWTANIATLTVSQPYYLYWNGTGWVSTTTSQSVDGSYLRSFKLDQVYRDGVSDIASSGTLDPNTRKLTVSVSWTQAGTTTTRSLSTYITNLFGN